MMNRNTKIVGITSLVVVLLSLSALGLLFFLLKGKESAFLEEVEDRATRRATERQLASLETLAQNTQAEREAIEGYVLESDGVISFLSLVEALGAEQGLVVETTAITVRPLGGKGMFETLSLTVQSSGLYDDVVALLDVLEALPYQSSVTRATLQRRGTGGEWSGVFDLTVTKFAQ